MTWINTPLNATSASPKADIDGFQLSAKCQKRGAEVVATLHTTCRASQASN
jgi:hypothetical protein